MTMFRKVFSNHLAAKDDGATEATLEEDVTALEAGPAEADADALQSDTDQVTDVRATLAAALDGLDTTPHPPKEDRSPAPTATDNDDLHLNPADPADLRGDDAVQDGGDTQPAAPNDQPAPESLAARAAHAHQQILATQASSPPAPDAPMPAPAQGLRLVSEADEVGLSSPSSASPDRGEAQTNVAPISVRPPAAPPVVPAPENPGVAHSAGRARTRLLGFGAGATSAFDPFAEPQAAPSTPTHPTGWLVVTKGPGAGASFPLYAGVAMVGRGEDQPIRLDFGDQTISRQNHAAVAYDPEDNAFYLGHGGKSNIIKLNRKPVLSTEQMHHADTIRIGETELRLVALCGDDFQWGVTDAT